MYRVTTTVAMHSVERTEDRPPQMDRRPHQGGDLPAVQCAQFRQVSRKSEGKLLSHAGDEPQEVVLLTPYGTLAESLPQVLVQVFQLLLQPADAGLNAGRTATLAVPRRFFSETSMVSI